MANIFAGSEVVEIGIQIEKNGGDYYRLLAANSKNTRVKELFDFLASEEDKHIKVFQGILSSVEKYEPVESYPGEYTAYMRALAGEYIFTQKDKGKEVAGTIKSDLEAAQRGIAFEKDSIIFYEGMKRSVPQEDHKILDALIDQEKQHLVKLAELEKVIR